MLKLSTGVSNMPDKFIYKLTYQIEGHSQEGPLFSEFNGKFGIADIIGHYNCGPGELGGSTKPFFKDSVIWNILGQQELQDFPGAESHDPVPEVRELQCIAISGEGLPLLDLYNQTGGTPSPAELLETILHAIIGE
jgi:hypothetical protein